MAKPIIPWIGGKRKLAKHILPLFPEHTCYVEPFCGAAALFFMKEPSKAEILNDINGDLVNLYRVVKYHLEPLFKEFQWTLCSRENWKQLHDVPPDNLTDIQRAARFLYLQKLAFGGTVANQTFGTCTERGPRLNLDTFEQMLLQAHHRLAHATIEHQDWEQVIKRYDRPYTLFYCDPPYWKTAGYGVKFGFENYERLAELAKSIKGKMIISLNNHPDILEVFEGMNIKTSDYSYTNCINIKKCKELIITN